MRIQRHGMPALHLTFVSKIKHKPGRSKFEGPTLIVLSLICALSVSSCGSLSGSQLPHNEPNSGKLTSLDTLATTIEDVARRADGTFEDAWICNRNARVLKTGYSRVSPKEKAKFALSYRKMLEAQGENLAADLNSYVPYKKRSDFTLDYWRHSEYAKAFEAETKKKKVQWIYESMLDAGELFWRAYELLRPEQVNSAAVLAHYKEQDMVFNYMEDERTPGSYSDQYVNWNEKDKAVGK